MKKIKNINWFWKNWTESEKRIYKKCAVFAIIVIMIEIMLAIACVNQFHATSSSSGHWVTEWNDEKGEWESVWMPWGDGTEYTVDTDGALYLFKRIFNIIYNSVLPITSVLTTTLVGYHYLMIMTSKNKRRIEDSYAAIKSVAVTWLYIMCISVFITLAMQGFNTLVNNPALQPILKP